MSSTWHTAWQNQDIVVYKHDRPIDTLPGADIQRVVFVYANRGDSPGDLLYAAVETPEDWVFLPAESGFSGRVNFERQKFWEDRACVYWTPASQARLPLRFRRSQWLIPSAAPPYSRIPKAQLDATIVSWPLEGPQTWEQRKWQRIQRSRPFTAASAKEAQDKAGRPS